MTTKLISANMGIVLLVERDGKQEKKSMSVVCPAQYIDQPFQAVNELLGFLNDELGTEYVCYDSASEPITVKIARPAKIKAHKPISQDEFNQRIKEIVP